MSSYTLILSIYILAIVYTRLIFNDLRKKMINVIYALLNWGHYRNWNLEFEIKSAKIYRDNKCIIFTENLKKDWKENGFKRIWFSLYKTDVIEIIYKYEEKNDNIIIYDYSTSECCYPPHISEEESEKDISECLICEDGKNYDHMDLIYDVRVLGKTPLYKDSKNSVNDELIKRWLCLKFNHDIKTSELILKWE